MVRVVSISVKTAIERDRHAPSLIHIGYTPTFAQIRTRHILSWPPMAYAAQPAARTSNKAHSTVSEWTQDVLYEAAGAVYDRADSPLVCSQCSEDYGLCDRCYGVDKHCGDTSHTYMRYSLYRGEKHVSKVSPEKDLCQFCKVVLGAGPFYRKPPYSPPPPTPTEYQIMASDDIMIRLRNMRGGTMRAVLHAWGRL